MKSLKYFFATALCWWVSVAFAENPNVTQGVVAQFKAATMEINTQLAQAALATATAALALQWTITYSKEVFNGDISNTLAKTVGIFTWWGISVTLITHQTEFGSYFDKYVALSGSLSGLSPTQFQPGAIINQAVTIISNVNIAFSKASNSHWWQVSDNLFGALMLSFANIFTFLAFLVIALSVFVAQLEFWVMFSVAPLAFGLIPLSSFRDQGIAPVKGLMSLGLRIIILGVVVSVTTRLTTTLINLLTNPGLQGGDSVFDPVWYYLAGMAACAMMALAAGKIASSIASGSASFSGADAIKGGMQMATTAALGAGAVVAGKAALGALAGKAPSSNALGNAVGSVLPGGGGGHMGVSPSGAAGGGKLGGPLDSAAPASGGGDSPAYSLGGDSGGSAAPASDPASGGSSAASGGGAGGSAAPMPDSAAGNASSAGIGGAQPSSLEKTVADLAKTVQGKQPTAMQRLGVATRAAAEQNAQDQHAVNVSINTRGD